MSIGVAIPCYCGHIKNLENLLDSIENQTVKPTKVVVSCSSTKEKFETKQYSFPLEILIHSEYKNASQNRNIATGKLNDMKHITFIDADDIMHPQRIEILLKTFEDTDCDIILHNYYENIEQFNRIENVNIRINQIIRYSSGCGVTHIDYKFKDDNIHHSQSSVKTKIMELVKYPEEKEYVGKEDSVFCNRVLRLNDIKNVYIQNKLSYYNKSGSWCI